MARLCYVFLAVIFLVNHVASLPPRDNPPTSSPTHFPSVSSSNSATDGVGMIFADAPSASSTHEESKPNSSLVTFLYELYEHEIYNQKTDSWTSRRFTQSPITGGGGRDSTSLDPQHCSPPRNYLFDGEWKIDMASESRDGFGWEYYVGRYDGLGRRRRRWVRSLIRMRSASIGAASVAGEKSFDSRKKKHTTSNKSKQSHKPSMLRAMQDQYNFKGFGWSINKSLIFAKSVGATFRIPLSANFDSYEQYRAAPFISTGAYFGYPLAVAALLNASVPVEAIKWAIGGVMWKVQWALAVASALVRCVVEAAIWVVLWPWRLWSATVQLMGIVGSRSAGTKQNKYATEPLIDDDIEGRNAVKAKQLIDVSDEGSIVSIETHIEINNSSVHKEKGDAANVASIVDSPRGGASDTAQASSFRKKHLTMFGSEIPPFHRTTSIEYSSIIQERLGVSLSWRLSRVRGYEYRCNFFFSCMPTRIFWGQMEQERKRQVDRVRRAVDFRGSLNDPSSVKHAGTAEIKKIDENNASFLSILSSFLTVGISTGWPLPMEPYFALNLVLSLSGFYYGWLVEYIRSIFVPSLRGTLEVNDKDAKSEKLVSSALKKNLPLEEEVDDEAETDDEASITKKAIV
ncbi:hypothetical protein ACHAW5_003445 [Stephanodiscus triporus]|uniref:TECPR1-like DysF domain-containing protein n=1 Tax=Stephanodiscus triporus TaxID=2934178 RepID=A0ABD3N6Z5_9STRA